VKRYLLDTAPLAGYVLARPAAIELIGPWIARREVATIGLVQAEVLEYLLGRADFSRRRAHLVRLLRSVRPSPLTFGALERYGQIRRLMRPPAGPGLIGDIDTLIAATAMERGLKLVTTDADFSRVPGLDVMVVSLTP
jgi:predicted nucleic acid-binding protein